MAITKILEGSGTSGLWSLVTERDPAGYDYSWYTDLLHQTDALYQGFDRHTRYPYFFVLSNDC